MPFTVRYYNMCAVNPAIGLSGYAACAHVPTLTEGRKPEPPSPHRSQHRKVASEHSREINVSDTSPFDRLHVRVHHHGRTRRCYTRWLLIVVSRRQRGNYKAMLQVYRRHYSRSKTRCMCLLRSQVVVKQHNQKGIACRSLRILFESMQK